MDEYSRLQALARALQRAETCLLKGGSSRVTAEAFELLSRRASQAASLPPSSEKEKLLRGFCALIAVSGEDIRKARKAESSPSLKPPKEWFASMKKKVGGEGKYTEEQRDAIVGNIWYHRMSTRHKSQVRKREGKKYGKALTAKKSLSSGVRFYIPRNIRVVSK